MGEGALPIVQGSTRGVEAVSIDPGEWRPRSDAKAVSHDSVACCPSQGPIHPAPSKIIFSITRSPIRVGSAAPGSSVM